MTTLLNKDTKMVLKLDLCEGGVRRVPFAKLWDDSRSIVSYDRLITLAADLKGCKLKAVLNGRISLSTTYTDEDGDEITISSDEELTEAFVQFVNSEPPVVRAKVVAVKNKKSGSSLPKQDRIQNRAIRAGLENLNKVDTVVPLAPVVRLPPVSIPVAKLVPETTGSAPSGFDPNFIHGRHTCDGCLATPIYGIRYHALNLPDYDLCSSCHGNYKGPETEFKPMQLDRDRHLQSRWQRRRTRRCRPMVRSTGLGHVHSETGKPCAKVVSGTQTKKVIDGMDDALKEAIRRSLVDAWHSNAKKTEKAKAAKAESSPAVPEEKKEVLPVGSVVEVTAGNAHTQKALDGMDPKMKEALSRSLNDCFARRANRNESGSLKDTTLDISPDDNTQKKIDTMDAAMKEAIRRSLTDFFANRIEKKEDGASTPEPKEDSNDDIQRTQEILETMDAETKKETVRSLNDFFVRRMKTNETENSAQDTTEVQNEVQSVVVDIIVDDDDDDLSEGTEDVNHSIDSNNDSNDDTDDTQSNVSEDSVPKDEWQMVTEDDEMIAMAAQMLGSALFQSDASLARES